MSTRALVGMVLPGGKVRFVYVHSDGFAEDYQSVGWHLARHYSSAGKVAALLRLGALYTLGPEVGRKHGRKSGIDANGNLITTAFARDLGAPPHTTSFDEAADVTAFDRLISEKWEGCEFGFLFMDGVWVWRANGSRGSEWYPLRPPPRHGGGSAAERGPTRAPTPTRTRRGYRPNPGQIAYDPTDRATWYVTPKQVAALRVVAEVAPHAHHIRSVYRTSGRPARASGARASTVDALERAGFVTTSAYATKDTRGGWTTTTVHTLATLTPAGRAYLDTLATR